MKYDDEHCNVAMTKYDDEGVEWWRKYNEVDWVKDKGYEYCGNIYDICVYIYTVVVAREMVLITWENGEIVTFPSNVEEQIKGFYLLKKTKWGWIGRVLACHK